MENSSKIIHESLDLAGNIDTAISVMVSALKGGKKIIVFGNGGSAADSQHFAAELLGRFQKERQALKALSLTTDTSALTAIGNDYSFDLVFSRQCEALVNEGDVILAISTSGKSKNVIKGVETSKMKGASIVSLLGGSGGGLKGLSDVSIIVNSTDTANIQEVHRVVLHVICKEIENELIPS